MTSIPIADGSASASNCARDEFSLCIPPDAWTWRGFREWARTANLPPTCRLSYVDGAIFIDASPQRLNSHVAVRGAVSAAMSDYLRGRDLGMWVCGRIPVSHEAAALSTEPDGTFVAFDSVRAGRVRLVPTADGTDADELEGSPDLVCEVVSPASEHRDTVSLRACYHRAGIPEYWLIDARDDQVRVDVLRHTAGGYESVPMVDGWLSSPVLGVRLGLQRVRERAGLRHYVFQITPLDPAPV